MQKHAESSRITFALILITCGGDSSMYNDGSPHISGEYDVGTKPPDMADAEQNINAKDGPSDDACGSDANPCSPVCEYPAPYACGSKECCPENYDCYEDDTEGCCVPVESDYCGSPCRWCEPMAECIEDEEWLTEHCDPWNEKQCCKPMGAEDCSESEDGYCEPGLVCTHDSPACCDAETPRPCGDRCCREAEECSACGCLSPGQECCIYGRICPSGTFCGRYGECPIDGSLWCSRYYCDPGYTCAAGAIRCCPNDRPVDCGEYCCPPGHICVSGCGGCVPDGSECCSDGRICPSGTFCGLDGTCPVDESPWCSGYYCLPTEVCSGGPQRCCSAGRPQTCGSECCLPSDSENCVSGVCVPLSGEYCAGAPGNICAIGNRCGPSGTESCCCGGTCMAVGSRCCQRAADGLRWVCDIGEECCIRPLPHISCSSPEGSIGVPHCKPSGGICYSPIPCVTCACPPGTTSCMTHCIPTGSSCCTPYPWTATHFCPAPYSRCFHVPSMGRGEECCLPGSTNRADCIDGTPIETSPQAECVS